MKKIGVLTFHRAINNGAVLQAFALLEAINSIGFEAEDIDYTAKSIKDSYVIVPLKKRRSLKSILLFFLQDRNVLKTYKKFYSFVTNNLKISSLCYDNCVEKVKGKYEVLIVGSDQVWNGFLTNNDINYFFSFDQNVRKCSYGASIGKTELSEDEKILFKDALSVFSKVTVREESAVTILDSIGIKSDIVPDPVYLVDKRKWESHFGLKKGKKKFILYFQLHENALMLDFALKLSKRTGYPIYMLTNDFTFHKRIHNIKAYGPNEFLEYIYGAAYVVSDSFHAVSMSLILNKEVFIGLKTGNLSYMNSRIESLVDIYNIKDRIISEQTKILPMDYENINREIDLQRKKGLLILEKMISL